MGGIERRETGDIVLRARTEFLQIIGKADDP